MIGPQDDELAGKLHGCVYSSGYRTRIHVSSVWDHNADGVLNPGLYTGYLFAYGPLNSAGVPGVELAGYGRIAQG